MGGRKKITLTIPESMHEVTLATYSKYMQLIHQKDIPEDDKTEQAVQLLCGLTPAMAQKMPIKQRAEVMDILKKTIDRSYGLQQTFMYAGTEFGFHPILDELTLGEFVDARKYAGDPENLDRFLAVLYRPITTKKRSRYQIEAYEGTDKYREVMAQQSAAMYIGVEAFFLLLASTLMSSTLSSMRRGRKSKTLRGHLVKSGAITP